MTYRPPGLASALLLSGLALAAAAWLAWAWGGGRPVDRDGPSC